MMLIYITNITKKTTETLVVASKEIGLEVTARNTKYTFRTWDRNSGQNQSKKMINKSFEKWNISNILEQT
jgi:hypothetical protein